MSKGEREIYRARAINADARAQGEGDPELRKILEGLAISYRTLATEADRFAHASDRTRSNALLRQ